uniref:Uncharacterized protein n=1 Tax=Rhizophora mucronata TaxID=61149 RepID=A0A2P2PQ89_RHIMU
MKAVQKDRNHLNFLWISICSWPFLIEFCRCVCTCQLLINGFPAIVIHQLLFLGYFFLF